MPVFAWLSAHAYVEIGRGAIGLVRGVLQPAAVPGGEQRRRGVAKRHPQRWALLAPVVAGVALTVANIGIVDALYLPFARRRYGTAVQHFTWQPVRYFRSVDPLVKALFWESQYDPVHPPSGIAHYLQHESEQITTMDQVYAVVRRYTTPDESIFGETGLIPLIASETGRRVAANLIDTSTYRISYGLSRIEDWIADIEKDHVSLLVGRERQPPMSYPRFREYAQRTFHTVARVRDPQFGVFEVLRRNQTATSDR